MKNGQYTFRQYLRDRGEEGLIRNEPEPEITGLILREVKLASAAFLALVIAVVLVFYQPDKTDRLENPNTLRTIVPESPNPFQPPSRNPSSSSPPRLLPAPPASPAASATRSDDASGPESKSRTSPPPAKETQPAPQPVETAYTVKSGDTLEGISRRFYGTGRHWRRIAERNGIDDPLCLRIGIRLAIPAVHAREPH